MFRRIADQVLTSLSQNEKNAPFVAKIRSGETFNQIFPSFNDFPWLVGFLSEPLVSSNILRDQIVEITYQCPIASRKFKCGLVDFCSTTSVQQLLHSLPNLLLERPTSRVQLPASFQSLLKTNLAQIQSSCFLTSFEMANAMLWQYLNWFHVFDGIPFVDSPEEDEELEPFWKLHSNLRFWLSYEQSARLSASIRRDMESQLAENNGKGQSSFSIYIPGHLPQDL